MAKMRFFNCFVHVWIFLFFSFWVSGNYVHANIFARSQLPSFMKVGMNSRNLNYPMFYQNQNVQPYPSTPIFSLSLSYLSKYNPPEAFTHLLRSLTNYNMPDTLITAKDYLIRLVKSNDLQVQEVLDRLLLYSDLSEQDQVILGLLLLADTLPSDCDVKSLILEMAAQLMKNKLLNPSSNSACSLYCYQRVKYLESMLNNWKTEYCFSSINPTTPYPTYPPFISQPSSLSPYPSCNPTETVDEYKSSPGKPPVNPISTSTPDMSIKVTPTFNPMISTTTENSPGNNMKDKLNSLIPKPTSKDFEDAFKIIQDFINNKDNDYIFNQLGSNGNVSDENLLITFYAIIQKLNTLDEKNKNIALAYIDYILGQFPSLTTTISTKYDYSTVLEVLPSPADDVEKNYIKILKEVLSSQEMGNLMHQWAEKILDQKKLLIQALKYLSTHGGFPTVVVEAAKYYLVYFEKLEALTLVGTKKIEKRFDLTGIFTDTLDLKSLPSTGKLAFKSFYKYIANLGPKEMENFNEWSEAKTRAEFIEVLFNYFLEQSFVPGQIKNSITILIPHIIKDGKGALPP